MYYNLKIVASIRIVIICNSKSSQAPRRNTVQVPAHVPAPAERMSMHTMASCLLYSTDMLEVSMSCMCL